MRPTAVFFSESAVHLITGWEPSEQDTAFPPLTELRTELKSGRLSGREELFSRCLMENELERASVDEALQRLAEMERESEGAAVMIDDIRPGTLLGGRYEIRRVLGEGATAITWLAYDTLADELFVLKRICNPEWYHYLSRHEFKQLLRLSHPNSRRVYEIVVPTEPFHLKMEYIAGTTLKELSDRGNSKELCLRVARDVLSALHYLESQGLIHRDFSPANIIIPEDEGEPVRLIDFGLASCDGDRPSLVGTPAYRVPEIERGEPWTHRCDIYSLAAVLFETLTGRLPYVTDSDLLRKDQPVLPTLKEEWSFGREFLRVLLKAAAPNPVDRYPSAEAFRKALDQAVAADNAPAADTGREEINPTVADLRQVYGNSTLGNNNNRGLASSFNQGTYVETKLDNELMPPSWRAAIDW